MRLQEARVAGETKENLKKRSNIRSKLLYRFWESLLKRSKDRTKLFATISPSHEQWITTSAMGKAGISLTYAIRQHDAQVELYIDRGKGAEQENKAIFNQLFELKETIEKEFQGELEWQRLETRREIVCERFSISGDTPMKNAGPKSRTR